MGQQWIRVQIGLGLLAAAGAIGCGNGNDPRLDLLFYLSDVTVKDVDQLVWRGSERYLLGIDGPGTGVVVRHQLDEPETRYYDGPCAVFANTVYASRQGVSPIQLRTTTQNAMATYSGSVYQIGGLVPASAFAQAADMLLVSHAESGAEVMVAAPPPLGDPNIMLGDRKGLATELTLAVGSFDRVNVFGNGMSGADTIQLVCSYPESLFMVDGATLTIELVDRGAREALEDMQINLDSLIISVDNEAMSRAFFPDEEPIAVRAGRAFSTTLATLTEPMAGDCSFPTTVPIDEATGSGKICFDQGLALTGCVVTSGDCPGNATYFEFQITSGSERRLRAGVGLQMSMTTAGTLNQPANGVDAIPEATDIMATAVDFNQNSTQVSFRIDGQTVTLPSLSKF